MLYYDEPKEACSKRLIADLSLFDTKDEDEWEAMYDAVINPKYKKNTRNFSRKITGTKMKKPSIYLIERERGGESYKICNPEKCKSDDLFFAPISKGYSMGDISSFTLGPVIGEGLCVVNAAFSKSICVMHLEGGNVDLKRRNFWKPKQVRTIELIDDEYFYVNNKKHNIIKWLKDNKDLWYPNFKLWSRTVALCSDGDFHWNRKADKEYSPIVSYYNKGKYLDYVTWKKECYIKPAYKLIKETTVYDFLVEIYTIHKISLGLVHPMARSNKNKAITKEYIKNIYDSPTDSCCMPYVVAGLLLGVEVD